MTAKLVTDVAQVQERLENDDFVLRFARIEWSVLNVLYSEIAKGSYFKCMGQGVEMS